MFTLMKRLKERVLTTKFLIIVLSAALVTTVVVAGVALLGVKNLTTPPARGQFAELLQQPPIVNPTNTTNSLFEHVVDELSGGVIPVILFPKHTDFCINGDNIEEHIIAACVDPFNPIYIAFTEEFAEALESNYEAATAAGLEEEAELVNQWERHLAAHEFAHVLQFNYWQVTEPFQKHFEGGFRRSAVEDMAECYAQLQYPLDDKLASKPGDYTMIDFYGFAEPEPFALCSQEQLDTIEEWLEAIPYPVTNRSQP